MDNKLSELSKPVMYVVRTLDGSVASVKSHSYTAPKGFTSEPLYSQEYVSALLAELEKKDREIAVIAMVTNDQLNDVADHWRDTLTESQTELEEKDRRIAELEVKLATPVRLSQRYETAGYCIDEHYCQEAADGDYLDRDELIASLHEQGFTVEGDEQ